MSEMFLAHFTSYQNKAGIISPGACEAYMLCSVFRWWECYAQKAGGSTSNVHACKDPGVQPSVMNSHRQRCGTHTDFAAAANLGSRLLCRDPAG